MNIVKIFGILLYYKIKMLISKILKITLKIILWNTQKLIKIKTKFKRLKNNIKIYNIKYYFEICIF